MTRGRTQTDEGLAGVAPAAEVAADTAPAKAPATGTAAGTAPTAGATTAGAAAGGEPAGKAPAAGTADKLRDVAFAAVVGVFAGLAAVLLSVVVAWMEGVHAANHLTTVVLPLLAVAEVALYRALKVPFGTSTASILAKCRAGELPSWKVAPAIFLGTTATIAGGGSVGKEAAALQMGAGVSAALVGLRDRWRARRACSAAGASVKTAVRAAGGAAQAPAAQAAGSGAGQAFAAPAPADAESVRMLLVAGMAGGFASLMFAPFAAAVFVLEIARLHRDQLRDLRILCVPVAAGCAYAVAELFGVGRMWVPPAVVPPADQVALEVGLVSALCAFAGLAFTVLLKLVRTAASTFVTNPFVRTIAGAVIVMTALVLPDAQVASGTGMGLIELAIGGGAVGAWDFAWKFALTIACLAFGLKGGEIMPVLCVGACLGSTLGTVTGTAPDFMAGVGMVALFAACGRCPIAAFLLGVEAFGPAGAAAYAVAAALGLVAGWHMSLYDSSTWVLKLPWTGSFGESEEPVPQEPSREPARLRDWEQGTTAQPLRRRR
ncbi:MAG: chloride channel protein [Eggerthellaceae bacterium]|jgi:H+/Cl- antiporter ClcA